MFDPDTLSHLRTPREHFDVWEKRKAFKNTCISQNFFFSPKVFKDMIYLKYTCFSQTSIFTAARSNNYVRLGEIKYMHNLATVINTKLNF